MMFAVEYNPEFPYLVHYRVNTQTSTVKVEGLFHTNRDPEIWHERTMN